MPKAKKVASPPVPPTFATLLAAADEEDRELVQSFQAAQGTDKFQALVQLAEEAVACKETIDDLEAKVKEYKQRYDELRKTLIPEAMKRLGIVSDTGKGSFTFSGGKVYLETKVKAGCTKAMEPKFHAWLRSHNAADLIKEAVNVQTLSAFVRERRAEGLDDPPYISIFEEVTAKISK